MSERPGLSDAARRGLQRAGTHLVRAAIEVVSGLAAIVEEMRRARSSAPAEAEDTAAADGDQSDETA